MGFMAEYRQDVFSHEFPMLHAQEINVFDSTSSCSSCRIDIGTMITDWSRNILSTMQALHLVPNPLNLLSSITTTSGSFF